ncbi:MAG TPA: insulinase family protein [Gammaproteobacteria bacterium]|nr:insulinase family protein [Gammaproteobacteria bacterium]
MNRPLFDLPATEHRFATGLKAIVIPAGAPDIVNLQIAVHTGSRNEVEPGKSGFAHFFEHMMFRGTRDYPPERYQTVMTRAGADQNAYTTDDYTNYHITFTKPDLKTVLRLEADRFQNLELDEEGFRTEALAVKGEYLKNYSDPTEKMFEVLRDLAYKVHPYKHTTMGFFADIEAMPEQIDYARTFFSRWYRPNNATMLVTGDVEPDATLALIQKYWGGWQAHDYRADIPAEPAPTGPQYRHIVWQTPTQPWVMIAFHGPAFSVDDNAMAAADFIHELYFSPQSDLYQRLVVEQRKADELFAEFSDHEDPYLLTIGARLTDEAHARAVADAILETCARAATERADEAKLARVRDRLRYHFAHALIDAESIGDMLAGFMRFEQSPSIINKLFERYGALTADDLRATAAKYFTPAGRTIVSLANTESLGLEAVAAGAAASATPAPAVQHQPSIIALPADTPLVDISLVFKAGAADDPPGKRGLAALTATLVADGGSAARPRRAIHDALYPLAAHVGAQCDKEMTRFAGSVHRERLDDYYAILRELLLTPGWHETDFARIRERTINAIRTDLCSDNDEELGKEALYNFIYGGEHPYGHLNEGAIGDLEKLTVDDCRAFYRSRYTPDNLVIGCGGGYPQDFPARVQADFAGAQSAPLPAAMPMPPPIARREALIVAKETPAVAVSFGQPIDVVRGDTDWVALWLARAWLGEHRSSLGRLYQRIRELRGMNYGDYAYIEYFPDGMYYLKPDSNLARRQQIFQVWLRPLRDNHDAVFATRLALYELGKLVDDGLSAEGFEQTREFLHKYVALLVKSPARRLGYAIDSAWYGIGDFVDYVRSGLDGLTVEAVNAALRRHIDPARMKFVFVAQDAQDLQARLVNDTPSEIRYNTAKPAEVLEEDAVVGKLPLDFAKDAVQIAAADSLFA